MAIGAVARGDLVVVHSQIRNLHGLFVVDSSGSGAFGANTVTVMALEDAGALAGGTKQKVHPLDKTVDILAVHTAASISV
jgi:hypothetical protein